MTTTKTATKRTTQTPGELIARAPEGRFVRLSKIPSGGALMARRLKGATSFYWRVKFDGKDIRVPIGVFDSKAPPKKREPTEAGFSVAAAQEKAQALAAAHQANLGIGGHHELMRREAARAQAEREQREAEHRQAEAQREAERLALEHAQRHTLEKLLLLYADSLESRGAQSAGDVRSLVRRHVTPCSAVAMMPANMITRDHLLRLLDEAAQRTPTARTSSKLLSYIHAAYQRAVKTAAGQRRADFGAFGVQTNPAAGISKEDPGQAEKNPLSTAEMRQYWQAIKKLDGIKGAALRLHLLVGAARIAQLLRLKTRDIHPEVDKPDSIVLADSKGRPSKRRGARDHHLPLTQEAAQALADCKPQGAYALSGDGGVTHIQGSTLAAWAKDAPHGIEGFQLKRVRSGVETLLARCGVSLEIRGRLQSHGVTGIQSQHYDAYTYDRELRDAQERLFHALEGTDDGKNVIPLRRSAA